ncbi:MAG: DedA family protein, partial [Actinocatenispora sp.]
MFDRIVGTLSEAWWSYLLVMLMAAFDVIIPVLPSETVVITAGIIAGQGGLIIPLVLLAAAGGAFAGDNLAYWIGSRWQHLAHRWIMRGARGRRWLDWADRTLTRYGGTLIIVGRFIPGGRTATAIGSGLLDYPWRRFAAYDVLGAVTWATVAAMIGYVGGAAFQHRPLAAFALSFGTAILVAAAVDVVRRLVARRQRPQP